MVGNIQIEVLNENAVMVATHLKDVSHTDKQALVMALAQALDLTPIDVLTTSLVYPDFLAKSKHTKRIYRTAVPPLTNSSHLYPAIENTYWTTTLQSATMNTSTGGTPS